MGFNLPLIQPKIVNHPYVAKAKVIHHSFMKRSATDASENNFSSFSDISKMRHRFKIGFRQFEPFYGRKKKFSIVAMCEKFYKI